MKDIITSGEWTALEQEGKLEPREFETIKCYFCNKPVTKTAPDARGTEMPRCRNCNIYYQPQWTLQENGTLAIVMMPRLHNYQHTEKNEIPQATENETDTQPKQAETPKTDETAPQHKDVRGQILTIFYQKQRTIQTAEFLNLINASRQSITNALKKLIAEGRIHQPKRGTYEIIHQQNDNVS